MYNIKILYQKEDQRDLFLMISISILVGLVDVISFASIMPFIALLQDPDSISKYKDIIYYTGLDNYSLFNESPILFFGFFFIAVIFLSNILRVYSVFFQRRYITNSESKLSVRIFEYYLYQSYTNFLVKSRIDLSKNILSEIASVVSGVLVPLVIIITQIVIVIIVMLFLVSFNALVAFSTILFFGISYSIIFIIIRKSLEINGKKRKQSLAGKYKIVNEVFDAIQEVKIFNEEKKYVEEFRVQAKDYAKAQLFSQVFGQVPRFAMEAVAFIGIVIIAMLLTHERNNGDVIAILSMYAIAGYRLLPSIQQIYQSATQLKYSLPALEAVSEKFGTDNDRSKYDIPDLSINEMIFPKNNISFRNVSFVYPETNKIVLNQIDIEFRANEYTAIVGTTGSGKSTILNLLLGLISPTTGEIYIDDVQLNYHSYKNWNRCVGYVPQVIHLFDMSIAENIAFGEKQIDFTRIGKVLCMVDLYKYVTNLESGVHTKVGEKGIKLSGGQRQRIGIARALYRNPKVLILDEATNALDNQTESFVINSLNEFSKDMTVIVVTHRNNTIQKFKNIYKLDKGRLIREVL